MGKAPDLREIFDPPDEIVQAGLNGDLVFFVGAGASMLLGLPSWSGLAVKALEDLRQYGYLNYSEIEQLNSLDPKKQLSIAYSIAEDNRFILDLTKHLAGEIEGDSIYKAINDIGCPCVTTNYDELLAPRFLDTKDGSTTAASVNRVYDREKFFAKLLNEPGTVVHLHGAISKPERMIVTTKDYLEHYDHENVQEFLGELFEKKTILFLGYGLEEAEVLEHILRRGSVKPTHDRRRFALQGFFLSQKPLYENLHTYYEKSFGVHLLGFVRDHENYKRLEAIIKTWENQIVVSKPPLAVDNDFMDEVLDSE
ncbi:SIR2 family protein [Dasania sp. GY-MA-18]|uniref:SIR2 family protein n=1 Tax=Dasania phycosphaerae TaxID=2950436 RepID=A0A9J6RM10_9GAMM|nr:MULTISPECIES: SIR2 family protein [Dasania]MCR8922802.1 SIR2 family protein [Dasania sp. GY-MA-18]MCZ0865232.1 SIR2 family protein [Dasania phycosphaerae]MCZ0868958.1 SIR2 family protein [Dasania phycosphaerae]